MKKWMMSLMAAGSALMLAAGTPAAPAAYVPTDSKMVCFVDAQRFLDNAQIKNIFDMLKNQMNVDVVKEMSDSLAQESLTVDDMKAKFYFFDIVSTKVEAKPEAPAKEGETQNPEEEIQGLASDSFGILMLTEGGKAEKLFQKGIEEAKAKKEQFTEESIGGCKAVTKDDGSAILLSPDAILFLKDVETAQAEEIMKATGKNAMMDGLIQDTTVIAFRGKPDPAAPQNAAPLTASEVTVVETNGDMDILVHGELESAAAAQQQMKAIQQYMMQLQMFSMMKPELAPLINQISVQNKENVIDIRVPQAGTMAQKLIEAIASAQQMQQQMQQQMMQQAQPPQQQQQ